MAYIETRVSGRPKVGTPEAPESKRIRKDFPNTKAGIEDKKKFVAELVDVKVVYNVRYRINGRLVTDKCNTKREAETQVIKVENARRTGTSIDPALGRETFGAYAETWLEHRVLEVRTRELYEGYLRNHIYPTFKAFEMCSIAPTDVRNWYGKVAAGHPTTRARVYSLLNTILSDAVTDRVIGMNPCTVKGGSTYVTPERPTANLKEVQALLDTMPDRLQIVVLIATWCTLRRGELLGLRRRDLDLENGILSVVQTRQTGAKGQWIVKGPKSPAGRRRLAIPPGMIPALSYHLEVYVAADDDALVLTGVKGGPLYPHVLQGAWDKARESIGRPELHLHDLRHTGGTLVASTGAGQKEIMARLGQSTNKAALIYQHATSDRDAFIADALDNLRDVVPLGVLAKSSPNED